MSSWLHRIVLAGLLLAAYLWAWTPLRTAWTKHSATLLEQVMNTTNTQGTVTARPSAHRLHTEHENDASSTYTAPAGVKFLLPAGFLLLITPGRPRIAMFFAGHLGLGLLALALLAGSVAGLPGGFGGGRFVQTYGVDAYSLTVPVLTLIRRQQQISQAVLPIN